MKSLQELEAMKKPFDPAACRKSCAELAERELIAGLSVRGRLLITTALVRVTS